MRINFAVGRMETKIVAVFVGIACPVTVFVVAWWAAASLAIFRVLPIPESGIAISAFAGLGAGIVLDILYLKRWVAAFYTASVRLIVPMYLLWSAMAVAFFMGLPLGNLVLGTLAGLYAGRRSLHTGSNPEAVIRRTSTFTALVTGLEALPIGILVLGEKGVIEFLETSTGLSPSSISGPAGVALICALCLILMAVQFWATRAAVAIAFRIGRRNSCH